MKESERLLESLRAEKTLRIGQLEVLASDDGFVVYHRDDPGRKNLTNHASDDAFVRGL